MKTWWNLVLCSILVCGGARAQEAFRTLKDPPTTRSYKDDPPVTGPSDDVGSKFDEIQVALEKPTVSCDELNGLWFSLPVDTSKLTPRFQSIRERLRHRRTVFKCLTGAAVKPPPKLEERLRVYRDLLKSVEAQRAACSNQASCPGLKAEEEEVGRQAAHLIRVLPANSPQALEIEASLVLVFGSGLPNQDLIRLLRTRTLTEAERRLLEERLASDDPNAAAKALGILEGLKGKQLKEAETVDLVKAVAGVAGDRRFDPRYLGYLAEVSALLADPKRNAWLKEILTILVNRYGEKALVSPGSGLIEDLTKQLGEKDPDPKLVADFFNVIDPVILAQVQREVSAANSTLREPAAPEEYATATSPVLVYGRAALQDQRCAPAAGSAGQSPGPERIPGDQFLAKIVQTLNFRRGPRSGFRPFLNIPEMPPAQLEALKSDIKGIVRSGSSAPPCQRMKDAPAGQLRSIYDQLCEPPYAGVFLFELKPEDTGLRVTGDWWAQTARAGFEHGTLVPVTLSPDCTNEEEVGFDTSKDLAKRVSFFKFTAAVLDPDAKPPVVVAERPSPWLAAAFAGAPYIADPSSSPAATWTFSLLDGAFVAGAIGLTAVSIKYRNDFAEGDRDSLKRANAALGGALISTGLVLATRLIAGVVFETSKPATPRRR